MDMDHSIEYQIRFFDHITNTKKSSMNTSILFSTIYAKIRINNTLFLYLSLLSLFPFEEVVGPRRPAANIGAFIIVAMADGTRSKTSTESKRFGFCGVEFDHDIHTYWKRFSL